MFKPNVRSRVVSLVLAVMMLVTSAVPAFAMGYDDLQTVINMTGGAAASEVEFPDGVEQEPVVPTEDGENMPDTDAGAPPPSAEEEPSDPPQSTAPGEAPGVLDSAVDPNTPPDREGEPTIGSSGEDWLIPDGYVLYLGVGGAMRKARSARSEQTAIYMQADWSMTHRYPFGSGSSTMPAYIFTTADGRTAYCIEPARFNSTYGHLVTGQLQYDKLSKSKRLEIAKAIAANTSGASNHRMYLATQTIIWEIASGQKHRSGSIYNDVIPVNGLSSEYESILSAMENLGGEIPSFMGPDKNNAPYHQMTEGGGSWSVELENTNSSVTLKAGDFSSAAAFQYSVSGDTLTVTANSEPQADAFVEWSGGSGGSGLIFWVNDQNIQDKASWDAGALPGIGYMRFAQDATPPPDTDEEEEGSVGYLEITKYDGTNNLPLGGAVIVIPIPAGEDSVDVTVTEVTAPHLYQPDPTPQTVTVTAGEQVNVARVSFVNYPEPCSLTVYKYEKGNYGKALAGAKFRIRYADPGVSAQVWEETTKADGTLTIDPLPAAGTLVIEELEAPDGGYEIGEVSTQYVTVEKGEDKRVDVSNDKRPQLIVWKKDAVSGQLLQGATFKATCISNGMAKTAESGPDGKAVFDELMPNEEYRIEEIDPPTYFLPSTKVETVVIPDGSYQTIELTWENQPYSGLTIRKVSATDGRGLKGAVFGLYQGTEAESKAFLGEFQTDDNGRIVIDKLESNQYYTVVERQPPVNHSHRPQLHFG